MAAGLMIRSTSSPWPFTRALTSPPPEVPSTSASASSCCALMRWSCICCAAASSCCRSIPPSGSTVPHLIGPWRCAVHRPGRGSRQPRVPAAGSRLGSRGSTAPPPRAHRPATPAPPPPRAPPRPPAVSRLRPSRHGRHTASRAERRSPEQRWQPHLFLRDHDDLVVPPARFYTRKVSVIKKARPMRLVSELFCHPQQPYHHDHDRLVGGRRLPRATQKGSMAHTRHPVVGSNEGCASRGCPLLGLLDLLDDRAAELAFDQF